MILPRFPPPGPYSLPGRGLAGFPFPRRPARSKQEIIKFETDTRCLILPKLTLVVKYLGWVDL